jgi:XTP/dITP diphosphohydrolase
MIKNNFEELNHSAMKLVIASQNQHKIDEFQQILSPILQIVPINLVIKNLDELPETGSTLLENARQKCHFVHQLTQMDCFADDSGLEIEALHGAPGVYSARYAGEEKNHQANIKKVLTELHLKSNRKACFVTVISAMINGNRFDVTGKIEGEILLEPQGNSGFGYDPIFKPNGFDMSFAQMDAEQKNKLSHRAQAAQLFLKEIRLRFNSLL